MCIKEHKIDDDKNRPEICVIGNHGNLSCSLLLHIFYIMFFLPLIHSLGAYVYEFPCCGRVAISDDYNSWEGYNHSPDDFEVTSIQVFRYALSFLIIHILYYFSFLCY